MIAGLWMSDVVGPLRFPGVLCEICLSEKNEKEKEGEGDEKKKKKKKKKNFNSNGHFSLSLYSLSS